MYIIWTCVALHYIALRYVTFCYTTCIHIIYICIQYTVCRMYIYIHIHIHDIHDIHDIYIYMQIYRYTDTQIHIHTYMHARMHAYIYIYTLCSLWLCRPLGAGLVAVRTNGFTGVGTPAGRLVGSERGPHSFRSWPREWAVVSRSICSPAEVVWMAFAVMATQTHHCGIRWPWIDLFSFQVEVLLILFHLWRAESFFPSLLISEPLCRQRPSQTSMTFIMSLACICGFGSGTNATFWEMCLVSLWFVVVPRRSSISTTERWDGLMTCTGHPGTGRKTSGADEHCMTGRRQRRLHRQGPKVWGTLRVMEKDGVSTCFERQGQQ